MEQHNNVPSPLGTENIPAVSHWHAGYNQPGYLPETEPGVYASFEAAREALADDMEHHAANQESWADRHDCDDVPCPAYGDDCPWQRAGDIGVERGDLADSDGPEWSGAAAGLAYWVTMCDDEACVRELVARIAGDIAADQGPLHTLAVSGAVLPGAADEADEHCQAATAADQSDLELLCGYLAAVGERGPIPGWPAP